MPRGHLVTCEPRQSGPTNSKPHRSHFYVYMCVSDLLFSFLLRRNAVAKTSCIYVFSKLFFLTGVRVHPNGSFDRTRPSSTDGFPGRVTRRVHLDVFTPSRESSPFAIQPCTCNRAVRPSQRTFSFPRGVASLPTHARRNSRGGSFAPSRREYSPVGFRRIPFRVDERRAFAHFFTLLRALSCVSCALDGRSRHGTKGRRAMGRKATQLVVHGASRGRRRWDSCGVVGETRGQARCGSAHEACDVGTACTVPDVRQEGRKSARGGVGDQKKEEEGKVR